MKLFALFALAVLAAGIGTAQTPFNGVRSNLSNLYQLSPAKTRSISPENFDGAKGGSVSGVQAAQAIYHVGAYSARGGRMEMGVVPETR